MSEYDETIENDYSDMNEEDISDSLNIGKQESRTNGPNIKTDDQSLGSKKMDAKRDKELFNKLAEEAKHTKVEINKNVSTAPTTKLLRASWEYLIPSWGLTWIYINIHWFMSCTWAEKFFAPLGHEWFLEAEKAGGVIAKQRIRTLKNRANLLEKMGVAFTDVALLAAFIFIATIFYLMFEYGSFFGLLKLGWELFTDLFS